MRLIKQDHFIIDSDTGELIFDIDNLPKTIHLDQCTFINDCRKFVESHFAYINTYGKSEVSKPYLDRLIKFKNKL